MTVDCLTEDARWDDANLTEKSQIALSAVLAHLNLPNAFGISVLGCDDTRIAALNAGFRGKATATNVLSWPSEDRAAVVPGQLPDLPDADDPMAAELGDIAISYDTCAAEAAAAGNAFSAHVMHLLVHGTLHLLGFDHENEPDAALMEGIETEVLGKLGLPDPYSVGPA